MISLFFITCNDIRAVFTEQIGQWQIAFLVAVCVKFKNSFAYSFLIFIQGIEIWNAIFFSNAYFCEELRQILCIIDDGVTWTLGSGNVLFQYVLVNQVLYVTYGRVF